MTYTISLKLGDKTLVGKGDTVLDALLALPKPDKIMAKGQLVISDGEKKKEQLLSPVKVKQLFYTSRAMAEVKAKQLGLGLK